MGRYIREVRLEQPIDVVSILMDDYVYHEHFSRTDWKDEMVFYVEDSYKKERYMKWSYGDGLFRIEAWLKNSLGGETDLDGVGGGPSRKEFRASIDGLIETLQRTPGESVAGGHIGSDPLHHDSGPVNNHDVWKADTDWQQGGGRQPLERGQSAAAPGSRPEGTRKAEASQGSISKGNTSLGNKPSGNTFPGSTTSAPSGRSVYRSGRDPEESRATIYAVLALLFGGWMPILGIVFIVMAWRKMDYSSNPATVKALCIIATVLIVLGIVMNFMWGFIGLL